MKLSPSPTLALELELCWSKPDILFSWRKKSSPLRMYGLNWILQACYFIVLNPSSLDLKLVYKYFFSFIISKDGQFSYHTRSWWEKIFSLYYGVWYISHLIDLTTHVTYLFNPLVTMTTSPGVMSLHNRSDDQKRGKL